MQEQHDGQNNTGTPILPPFDFTEAQGLTVLQRFDRSIEAVRSEHAARGYIGYIDELGQLPAIPPRGAADKELAALQRQLQVTFPDEYLDFLRRWRYIEVDAGLQIYGFDYDGVYPTGSPWVSDEHFKGRRYLIIGDCWNYADGDQLVVHISGDKCQQQVLLYLHEDGPRIEEYAPSFSLALWRLVYERL